MFIDIFITFQGFLFHEFVEGWDDDGQHPVSPLTLLHGASGLFRAASRRQLQPSTRRVDTFISGMFVP